MNIFKRMWRGTRSAESAPDSKPPRKRCSGVRELFNDRLVTPGYIMMAWGMTDSEWLAMSERSDFPSPKRVYHSPVDNGDSWGFYFLSEVNAWVENETRPESLATPVPHPPGKPGRPMGSQNRRKARRSGAPKVPGDRYLTGKQAAVILGLKEGTFSARKSKGTLTIPETRFGRRVYYLQSDVEKCSASLRRVPRGRPGGGVAR